MTPLPYGRQTIEQEDIDAVVTALRGDLITTGPAVEAFEAALASETGMPFAAVVNSGTAALHCAYHVVGLGPGKSLLTSPLTFAATANAALYLGADVRFADIDPDTGCLDPAAVAATLTTPPDVVTAVDYAGHPADYSALDQLRETTPFHLIADACHSLGGSVDGRPSGSLADLSCFSFHPVKPITTAEGGAVVTANRALDERIRRFRNHGIVRSAEDQAVHGPWFYAQEELGYNYRLSDLHAALGLSQLRRLREMHARRVAIARSYTEALADIAALELPTEKAGFTSGWHLYVVRVREAVRRRPFFEALQAEGLGVQLHYLPVYLHPHYRRLGFKPGLCPVAEDFAARALSLPLFPGLHDTAVERVVDTIRQVAKAVL